MKTATILAAAKILAAASLSKLETAEKFALIRAAQAIRTHAEAYDAALRAAAERLRPADYDAIAAKEQAGTDRTPEELAAVVRYNTELNAFAAEELDRDIPRPFDALTEDALGRLADSNPDLTLADLIALKEALVD